MEEEWNISLKLITSFVAGLDFLAFCCCLFFLISMSTSKNGILRGGGSKTYNVYIFFLIVPDTFYTLIHGLWQSFSASYGGDKVPLYFVRIFTFLFHFYYSTNIYLNAVLAYEMNILVRRSYKRIKMPPPKLRRVLIQVICIYVFSAFWALGNSIKLPWSIQYYPDLEGTEYVDGTELFITKKGWILIVILYAFPMLYVPIIQTLIWWKKLLPKSGRTRVLSLFFSRIVIVFYGFYYPSSLFVQIYLKTEPSELPVLAFWSRRIVSCFAALQSIFTLIMVSKKDDIKQLLLDNSQKLIAGPYRRSIDSLSAFLLGNSSSSKNESLQDEEKGDKYNEIEERMIPTKKSQWDEEDVYDDDEVDCCVEEEKIEEDKASSLKICDETNTNELYIEVTTEKNKKNNIGENEEEKTEL